MEGLITAATGVDVEMIQAPSFTDYQTKVATLLSSGDTSIDLFDIDEYITCGNILGGFFEPLNDIFSADDLAAARAYPSAVARSSTSSAHWFRLLPDSSAATAALRCVSGLTRNITRPE